MIRYDRGLTEVAKSVRMYKAGCNQRLAVIEKTIRRGSGGSWCASLEGSEMKIGTGRYKEAHFGNIYRNDQ